MVYSATTTGSLLPFSKPLYKSCFGFGIARNWSLSRLWPRWRSRRAACWWRGILRSCRWRHRRSCRWRHRRRSSWGQWQRRDPKQHDWQGTLAIYPSLTVNSNGSRWCETIPISMYHWHLQSYRGMLITHSWDSSLCEIHKEKISKHWLQALVFCSLRRTPGTVQSDTERLKDRWVP